MTIKDIEEYIKNNNLEKADESALMLIMDAINDWPNDVNDLEDFTLQVNIFLKGKLTKENIETKLKQIDYSIYAWQAESLSQVLEIFFYFDNSMSVEEIIESIKTRI